MPEPEQVPGGDREPRGAGETGTAGETGGPGAAGGPREPGARGEGDRAASGTGHENPSFLSKPGEEVRGSDRNPGNGRTATTRERPSERLGRRILADILNWGAQLILAVVGAVGIFAGNGPDWIMVWCALASVYAVGAVVALSIRARREGPAPAVSTRLWLGKARLPIAWAFTIIPAAIGVAGALSVIEHQLDGGSLSGDGSLLVKVLGVWAMLLGWAFMHWGYAQIYLLRSDAARPRKILDFPNTERPSLVDHVYFAFTVGTTFAASDVTVLDTRTRWTVTVHSVISFALNALTIALAFNTIMNAGK